MTTLIIHPNTLTHKVQHLAIVMVDKDVAGAEVFEIGDLQAIGISYLFRLEGCIDCVHFDYCLGLLSLPERMEKRKAMDSCVYQSVKC